MVALDKFKTVVAKYGIMIIFILMVVLFSILSPVFLSVSNIFNILRQVSIVGIMSVGMAFVIITSGIDLSVGSILGASGVFGAYLMSQGISPIVSIIIVLVASIVIGLINGFFINEMELPPFVSTLGMMTAMRGVAYLITNGMPIFGFPESFSLIGQGYIFVIPIPVIIMIVVFICGHLFLDSTKYGRYIYGVGGNEEATRLSGVNTKKIKYIVYALCSFLCGLAGIVLLSRINSGNPKNGTGYELDVITAVILGGVSVMGGEGKITGVIIGVLIMGVLANGMILLNVNEYTQQVVKGVVLLAAVSFDRMVQRQKKKLA